jgi:hypothetical protein
MADDTVDDARLRLEFVLSDFQDDMAELPPVKFAIDKLIAAVRADTHADELARQLDGIEDRIAQKIGQHFGKLGQEWVTKVTSEPDSE